ncbi:helix-turn-helix transcriptional regulator [Paenibacillus mesophilus]|uniref:helix-turn-helix domain-containing protein n=1 Tax=Paenibacillus mesophilus TaxID=2582849 RepID=UPI00110E25F0|nr:AraC family transcriptional regulator [Paenibacillus mesophilus]TMV43461.1 helix-turn-helix transcriptional regulator [Paenibacillus mesophilus]
MAKSGYRRWLLSYLPVFYVVICLLIAIFFIMMSVYSNKQAARSNEVFARNVLETLDGSLRFVEQTVIKEMLSSEEIRSFYETARSLTPLDYYRISARIGELGTMMSPLDSIYLYRESDGMVLTPLQQIELVRFGDRGFVEGAKNGLPHVWSERRTYQEFGSDGTRKQVVSLVKKVPLTTGSLGLLVANVRVDVLESMLDEFTKSEAAAAVQLLDAADAPFFRERSVSAERPSAKVKSAYTGWTVTTEAGYKRSSELMSAFSYVWFAAGLIIIAGGTGWMIAAVRRNYRPIQSIKESIQLYGAGRQQEPGSKPSDEFVFIRAAIDRLVEHSERYERQHREDLTYRRKWFFYRLLEGEPAVTEDEWNREMQRLGMNGAFRYAVAAIAEIDRHDEFCSPYSASDQNLLKFALVSVTKEIADKTGLRAWGEWIGSGEFGVLLFMYAPGDPAVPDDAASGYFRQLRDWIEANMKFTVSIGVGSAVERSDYIPRSFDEAFEALQYKASFGGSRVIGRREAEAFSRERGLREDGDEPDMWRLARSFRMGEPWEEPLREAFAAWRKVPVKREELAHRTRLVLYAIDKEMSGFPAELRAVWHETVKETRARAGMFDDADRWEEHMLDVLDQASRSIALKRGSRGNRELAGRVKTYIAQHFGDPGLSLAQVGDAFQLNDKSLSRMFKEEFGEKFVDYVAQVRIAEAKRLLLSQPSEPVLSIAQRAGYIHAETFIRVFKKLVGVTPGDYRKNGAGEGGSEKVG